MQRLPGRCAITTSGFVTVLTSLACFAQEPATAGSGLEEVVVTAQRRSENLQETPIAVTALSSEALASRNVITTQDLMRVTPGLQVSTQTAGDSGGSATFFLRGLGQQRSGNGSEPAVGIYIDDFYFPSLQGSAFSILDIQQVEVLRGPQGTLFGRNTIGGAVRYTTRKPDSDFAGYVTATVGNFGRADVTGVLNVPIGEQLAARLTVGRLDTEGFVKPSNGGDDAGGARTDLGRLQVSWNPSDALSVELGAQYTKQDLDGFAWTQPGPIRPRPGTLPFVWNTIPPLGGANPYDNRVASACDYCQPTTTRREFSESEVSSANATIAWDIASALTLKSLTGWFEIDSNSYSDIDGSPLRVFDQSAVATERALSQEFQLSGSSFEDRLKWLAGVYYYENDSDAAKAGAGNVVLGSFAPTTHLPRTTKTQALFVDATYALTDKLSMLAGIRRSKDEKDVTAFNGATGVRTDAETGSWSSTTPRLGLQYQWTDEIMTYVTASDGFRGGGFNYDGNSGQFFEFQPEDQRSYEAGARMDLLDRRLRLNPTVFYAKWQDIQVQSVVPTAYGVFIVLDNAAEAHIYGVELEAEAAVTDALRVYGNVATLKMKYDDIGSATGITLDSNFQRAPELTWSIGADYTIDFSGGGELVTTLGWSSQDEQNSTPTDADTLVLPAYGLLSARIAYTSDGGNWTAGVYGTNLTDEVYYVGGVNYAANVGAAHYDLGRPREYGLTLRYNF